MGSLTIPDSTLHSWFHIPLLFIPPTHCSKAPLPSPHPTSLHPSFCDRMQFSNLSNNTRFTLLNDQGDALSGFYMEIQSHPRADSPGQALYVDARGTTDAIRFLYNQETNVFESRHVKSPNNKFLMTPVLVGSDVVGLDVQFSHINNFVAHFALDISSDEDENIVYDVLAPPVHLNELSAATF